MINIGFIIKIKNRFKIDNKATNIIISSYTILIYFIL